MNQDQEKLYTPREVGAMFRVDPKTVTRWILSGKIPRSGIVRTLGKHIRIKESEVQRLWDLSHD
jgi:excisionase family DNA binding protein